jgi:hypothetical protein
MNETNSEWTDGQTRVIGSQFVNELINYITNLITDAMKYREVIEHP